MAKSLSFLILVGILPLLCTGLALCETSNSLEDWDFVKLFMLYSMAISFTVGFIAYLYIINLQAAKFLRRMRYALTGRNALSPLLTSNISKKVDSLVAQVVSRRNELVLFASTSPDPVFVIDDTDLTVKILNEPAEKLVGRDASTAVGTPFPLLFVASTGADLRKSFAEIQSSAPGSFQLNGSFILRSQRTVPAVLSLCCYRNRILVTARETGVMQSQQKSRSDLSHMIHSSFANSLEALKSFVTTLSAQSEYAVKRRRLASIRGQIDFLENMLLAFQDSQGKENLCIKADLTSLVMNVVDCMSPVANVKAIALGRHTIEDVVIVDIDTYKIERVLQNLIGNALKFSPPNSRIIVRQSVINSYCRIEVEDRGPGIPQGLLKEVFAPFKQAGKQAGFGLGLAICSRIIAEHSGEIGVHNNVETEGCCFWFQLPVCTEG